MPRVMQRGFRNMVDTSLGRNEKSASCHWRQEALTISLLIRLHEYNIQINCILVRFTIDMTRDQGLQSLHSALHSRAEPRNHRASWGMAMKTIRFSQLFQALFQKCAPFFPYDFLENFHSLYSQVGGSLIVPGFFLAVIQAIRGLSCTVYSISTFTPWPTSSSTPKQREPSRRRPAGVCTVSLLIRLYRYNVLIYHILTYFMMNMAVDWSYSLCTVPFIAVQNPGNIGLRGIRL